MKDLSLAGVWEFRQSGTQEWLPALVPGGVHTDLLALDRIPDPFVGDNEKKVQWVIGEDWEYRKKFAVEARFLNLPQIWLVCDGLDTLAIVKLNGQELGRAENMFRQYRWDVKSLLTVGENELEIVFDSPLKFISGREEERALPGVYHAIPGGPWMRKAPCQFGWDWGPKLPPIGIWKDIRLEAYQGARIEEVHLHQQHEDGQVKVSARVALQSWDKESCKAVLQLTAPDGQVFETSAEFSAGGETTLQVMVEDPQLWWPNGYGEQPLYKAAVKLQREDSLLDKKVFQLGLRTLELRQEPDEWGKSFTFVVNGLPVFAKGSNWIPADSFPTRLTDEFMESLIKAAADTHQNMLRVWGGGFYEEERFYDLCDRYGILVWQDFIFACNLYPWHETEYMENVRIEIRENIRRLRHRASLALWCGNNEIEWGWADWGYTTDIYNDIKEGYDRFFHHDLPEWVAAEDPDHSYWPSSPSSNTPFEDPNGQKQGDAHYWDVWHGGKPFTAYRDQFPRFMSEFGFQALPPMDTIRTYAEEADWNMTSYVMECHQKNNRGNALMVNQMLDSFRLPKDFESLVYLSMVLQAEGIRYGVEHWRRHPERVSGIIYWQLNDCWPVASWSSLDYFGRWKALHYVSRRFYAPLMMSIEDKPTEQNVYVTNEQRVSWEGTLTWTLETLNGKMLKSGEEAVKVAPFSVASVCKLDFTDKLTDENRRNVTFVAELSQDGKTVSLQTAFFEPTKHLKLVDPQIKTEVMVEGDLITIKLKSRSLARQVEIALEGADVVFSDNYFDLPANRDVKITAPLPAGWQPVQVVTALKVRSIYDSFSMNTKK